MEFLGFRVQGFVRNPQNPQRHKALKPVTRKTPNLNFRPETQSLKPKAKKP